MAGMRKLSDTFALAITATLLDKKMNIQYDLTCKIGKLPINAFVTFWFLSGRFYYYVRRASRMKTLNCDVCRKELVNPVVGRTYWHIREYDVCEACKEAIEAKIRPMVRSHVPYSQAWYEDEFITLIEKGIAARHP